MTDWEVTNHWRNNYVQDLDIPATDVDGRPNGHRFLCYQVSLWR